MKKVTLGDVCNKAGSNIAQKDLQGNEGKYPIYGASGLIKKVDFYQQELPYIAVVKDGAGIGRTMLLPGHSSVIGTVQYILPINRETVDLKYLYYAIVHMNLSKYFSGATIPHIYFKDYKKEPLRLPELEKQREIARVFQRIDELIAKREQQLKELDELVKSRFIELFGDPVSNPFGFEKQILKNTCKVITGNTPSRAVGEYYGDYIEWIKTDNIVTGLLNPTKATEYLSEKGVKAGRTVEKNSILMACIAGSIDSIGRVCITNRTVSFNQQINALVPQKYNVLFLYVLLQISKGYLVKDINMALKGILSKSRLERKKFIVPPIELQNPFADFVAHVDKSKYYNFTSYKYCVLAANLIRQEWMLCQTLSF